MRPVCATNPIRSECEAWRVCCVCCGVCCVRLDAENAAATSPAVAQGRLAASASRSAIGRLRSGSRPSPCNPSRDAGSAKGGGISRPAHSVSAEHGGRCGGAPPATARPSGVRRAIHPRLRSGALGRNTSRRAAHPHPRRLPRPAARACSASCRRLRAPLRSVHAQDGKLTIIAQCNHLFRTAHAQAGKVHLNRNEDWP